MVAGTPWLAQLPAALLASLPVLTPSPAYLGLLGAMAPCKMRGWSRGEVSMGEQGHLPAQPEDFEETVGGLAPMRPHLAWGLMGKDMFSPG